MKRILSSLLLLGTLLAGTAVAVEIRPDTTRTSLGNCFEYATTAIGARPDSNTQWTQNHSDSVNPGFVKNDFWLRCTLSVQDDVSPGTWFLDLNTASLREVELWHYHNDELDYSNLTGTNYSFDSRRLAYRKFAYRIDLRPGKHDIEIRIRSRSPVALSPKLAPAYFWFVDATTEQLFLGALVGILAILALYNLIIFAVLREPAFFLFFLALLAGVTWRAAATGFGPQYLYPDWPEAHTFLMRCGGVLYVAFLLLSTRLTLRIAAWNPLLDKVALIYGSALVLLVPFPVFAMIPMLTLSAILLGPLMIMLSSILAIRHQIPNAGFYATGSALFLVGGLMIFLRMSGVLPYTIATTYAGDLGILAMGMMLSVAMATRVTEEQSKTRAAVTEARMKSEFLANMSHEIRTPLNSIVGFSDILNRMKLGQEAEGYLARIQKSSQLLMSVINDVLDFSKLEADKLNLETKVSHTHQLLNDVEALFAEQATAKGLDLVIRNDAEDVWFLSDPHRLTQVLINLTGNAIKFTQEGTVTISCRALHATNEPEALLIFSVRDTGIGISPEKQAGLFQPFSQADTSTTRRFGGTGLGLSICKRIIEAMGGSIAVDSQVGKGSTFHFRIEVPTTSAPAANAVEHADAQLQGNRILVVEDNRTNQMLVRAMLEKLGVQCDVADHGGKALQLLAQNQYDLVFMDCQMPEMDGFTATQKIRSELNLLHLPIVALTANALSGDREACLQAGMNDYMTKPIRLEDLTLMLQKFGLEQAA